MKFHVNVKSLGKRKASVEQVEFEIPHAPSDVRELITEIVAVCVAQFHARADRSEILSAMTAEDIDSMAKAGKVAFGSVYGESAVDLNAAQDNAVQCFEDGIYRIFLDDVPLEDINQKINLTEDSCLTFVRLTMLAGRLW